MQLEPGKYYRTRDGRMAYVAKLGRPCDVMPLQAIGWLCNHVNVLMWCLDGRRDIRGRAKHCLDLVAPWQEPVEVEPEYLVWKGNRYRLVED